MILVACVSRKKCFAFYDVTVITVHLVSILISTIGNDAQHCVAYRNPQDASDKKRNGLNF